MREMKIFPNNFVLSSEWFLIANLRMSFFATCKLLFYLFLCYLMNF